MYIPLLARRDLGKVLRFKGQKRFERKYKEIGQVIVHKILFIYRILTSHKITFKKENHLSMNIFHVRQLLRICNLFTLIIQSAMKHHEL